MSAEQVKKELPVYHPAIDLHESQLTVTGATSYGADPAADASRRYTHVEFGGGQFRRSFTLSDQVERGKITAKLVNGVLNLFLPKSEQMKPRRIEIVGE